MVMIREESNVRDSPIYMQVGDRYDRSNSFWYVIEEKNVDLIPTTTIEEEIHHDDYDDDDRNNIVSVLNHSETFEIKDLQLPSLNSFRAKLVVYNSRIYLIGGYAYHKDDRYFKDRDSWAEQSKNVFYLDTNHREKRWLKGPTLKARRGFTLSVAALENSRLFAFGMTASHVEPFAEFLNDSLNGSTWSPAPAIPERELFEIDHAELLAVTDTKVYMHGLGENDCLGLSFDVQKSEWNIFDRSFHGMWNPGVVLDFCSNSYLFLFGVHGETYTENLWVYDLNKCTWLPHPVRNLPKDGTVLPDPEEQLSTHKSLLQMNQRNKNKLALVWSAPFTTSLDPILFRTRIHCTKFIISCDSDSDGQHPIFSAQEISNGSYYVRGGGLLFNCTASSTGKYKEEFGLLEEWKEN